MREDYKNDWAEASLVKDLNYLKTGVEDYSGKKDYYSTGSIKNDSVTSEGLYTHVDRPSRANRVGQVGDILQARMKNTDKAVLITNNLNDQLFSTGFFQIRADSTTILPKYLFHYFKSYLFLNQKDSNCSGSTQSALNDKSAQKLLVPIAPIPIQRTIIAKIEEFFSDLDKGIADLKKAQDQLMIFRQAVLKKAFEGELTKEWREQQTDFPKDWIKKSIKEVCENVKVGIVIKPTQYYIDDIENGIPAFRSANVREFRINDSNWVYFSEEGNHQNKRTQLNTGDVLIVRSGYPGTSCVVPEKFKGSNAIDILIATPNQELITPEFLCTFNNSPFAKGLFSEGSRGVAQKHLNVGVYSKLIISFPSIPEQKLILKEIESRLSVCDKVEQSITESLEKAKALRQSILKKAFEGSLLSEEEIAACKAAPDYEPASVLLEKIKANKKKP